MYDNSEIIKELKSCYNPKDYELNDWETIVDRSVDVGDGLVKYKTSSATIYLKDNKFYDAEPDEYDGLPMPKTDFSEEENEIIKELKSCYSPKEYELNDWKTILSRSSTDNDGITKYNTAFATIYLDKNNNFYDVEPFEVDDTINILSNNLNDDEILKVSKIKQYVLPKHIDLINWKIVLSRVKKIQKNLYLYPLGIMDLYLDENLNVVDYGRCHIIENQFWYDFNNHPIVAGEQYTFITNL